MEALLAYCSGDEEEEEEKGERSKGGQSHREHDSNARELRKRKRGVTNVPFHAGMSVRPYQAKRRKGVGNMLRVGGDAVDEGNGAIGDRCLRAQGDQFQVGEHQTTCGTNDERAEKEGEVLVAGVEEGGDDDGVLPLRLRQYVTQPRKAASNKTQIPSALWTTFNEHSSAVNTIKWSNHTGKDYSYYCPPCWFFFFFFPPPSCLRV